MSTQELNIRRRRDLKCGIICLIIALGLVAVMIARDGYALTRSVQTAEGEAPGLEKVPLVFQQVDVSIHNQVAAGQHWFHFKNEFEADVEVTCEFALAADEFVEGFSYYNGAERIVGEVLEKQMAEQVYDSLTGLQRDPGILEQVGNHFRFRVYPVQPGENKPVEVRTLTPLEMRENVVEYVIPKENLPAKDTVFSLRLEITDDLPIEEVETEGFNGIVKRYGPRHHRVVFEGENISFGRDLVIRYRLKAKDHAMRFVAHRTEGIDGSFMLLITPKSDVEESEVIGRDIVFVIDISGSMSGQPLEQTKWALAYIIERLNDGDRFDVVAFDDEPQPFFGSLKDATPDNLKDAITRVSDLETRGGTNIRGALQSALGELAREGSGRPRAVIFLTDGQGNSPPEVVLSEVRKGDNGARIYTFGVGSGVNRPFLERLARDNRGIATFIQDTEQIEKGMTRLYERISMPLMVDLSLEFEGVDAVSVYPKRLPDLYRDGEVVVLGRFGRPGVGKVKVSGKLKGIEKVIEMDITFPDAEERFAYVEKLWANRRISHLMDMVRDRGNDEELVQEVTRLGIVYNLVTEYTTFLAVPESLKTDEIKELIRAGKRGYDKRIIDSLEGVRLSQSNIPPGDPVLTVTAPADATKVLAYFPFGVVKRLKYDTIRGTWSVRFLVPRHVPDGVYEIRIHIVEYDGRSRWKSVEYNIDSTEPEFEAWVPDFAAPGSAVSIEVDPFEPVAEVYAYIPGVDEEPILFELDPETGTYRAMLQLPDDFSRGRLTIRIVVRDLARNRFERDFEILEDDDEIIGC